MKWCFALCLWMVSTVALAVVTRADVSESRYRVAASTYPALVDLPGEGHGVLIAPQWVLTAAHAAPMIMPGSQTEVVVGGTARKVKRVVTYPGYRKLPGSLVDEALASGSLTKVTDFLAASDDIALVELAAPVEGVTPLVLYRGHDEVGMRAELVGKGATGDGVKGQEPQGAHRGILRHAYNLIIGTDTRYVSYRFDPPPSALPLEGMTGGGDSGGPLFIGDGASRQVIGLASWSRYPSDHPFWKTWRPGRPFVSGLYGAIVYAVRVSRYIPWIDSVIATDGR
ncbi:trypsin-like serine protease [Luteibacter sp. PPL552]